MDTRKSSYININTYIYMSKFVNYLWETFTIKKSQERGNVKDDKATQSSKNFIALKEYEIGYFELTLSKLKVIVIILMNTIFKLTT